MAAEQVKTRVAIVGAGLSGLTAALRLVQAGVDDVVVVEARDRVGGRLLNQPISGNQVVEAGGQWGGHDHEAVVALAREVGVETFDFHTKGEALFEHRAALVPYSGPTPPIGSDGESALARATDALDQLAAEVPPDAPWRATDAGELDRRTLADWLDDVAEHPAARAALEIRMTLGFAMPTERISLLHAVSFFAGVGGWGAYQGRLALRFRGGSQAIPLSIAEKLERRVLLRRPLRHVDQGSTSGVALEFDGLRVRAERAVIALSPADCRQVIFSPSLPPSRRLLHSAWQAGSQIKVHAVYDEPFWRAKGLSGSSLSLEQLPHMTFDNSPPEGRPGVLGALFPVGSGPTDSGMRFSLEGAERRREGVLEAFARRFGVDAARPVEYFEQSWLAEPFTAGCVAPAPPRLLTAAGRGLREPVDRLHWASTETAERWNGWMEGAVVAGERAASEVLSALGSG